MTSNKYKIHEYDGTEGGLEKLCKIKNLCVYKQNFCFVDDKYKESILFTGNVKILEDGYELILRPGDCYQERIIEPEKFEVAS